MSPLSTCVAAVVYSFMILIHNICAQITLHGNVFSCSKTYQFANHILTCNPNEHCSISCTEAKCCRSAIIYAPNYADLTLLVGYQGAQDMTLYGASNGNVNVECTPWYGCSNAAIYAPTNGDLFLHCTGNNACLEANVSCPINGKCDILCDSGCSRTEIDATHMMDGSLSITAMRTQSSGAFVNSRIHCPANGNNCSLSCASKGCKNATIYANNDGSHLYIDAKGSYSLQSSRIFCPTANGVCSIEVNATEAAIDMISNAKIYAVNGFDDFYLECKYILEVNECYANSSKPILVSGSHFNESCDIQLASSYDQWKCINFTQQSIASTTSAIIDTSSIQLTQSTPSQPELSTKTSTTFIQSTQSALSTQAASTLDDASAHVVEATAQTLISSESASESTTKSNAAFIVLDELAIILIIICSSLCALVLIALIIFALFMRRENKRNFQTENKILEAIQIDAVEIEEESLEKVSHESVVVGVSTASKAVVRGEKDAIFGEDADIEDLYNDEVAVEEETATKQTPLEATKTNDVIDRESIQNEYDTNNGDA